MIKKSALIILTSCSLFACSSTELIHEPVDCLGQPNASLGLTESEYKSVTIEAEQKLIVFIKTLRARIDAQCELNRLHDVNHSNE